jgi:oligopeptide/dipeptide ABC transporter ATP-binding protein
MLTDQEVCVADEQSDILLDVQGLKKYFPLRSTGFLRRVAGEIKAVNDVSFRVRVGETVGVVGESGCGKTTLGRCIVRLYDYTDGDVKLKLADRTVSLRDLDKRDNREFRKSVQMIFQDPYSSLNPRANVLQIVGEPMMALGIAKGREMEHRVTEAIRKVGLSVAHLRRYAHSFSGGQRQRIGLARALVVDPRLVIADEPVSALDVSIQAQILNLMMDLQQEFGLAYVFISHDMSVVRYMSDRILVMYAGRLVETAPREDLLTVPQHPYTAMLLGAVPKVTRRGVAARGTNRGEPPNLLNVPSGCVFHPRCAYAQEICENEVPQLRSIGTDRHVSCHLAESLQLQGVT